MDSCDQGPQEIETDAPIPLEVTGLSNLNGTVGAARPSTDINGATGQWYINMGDDPALDTQAGGYAVFGKVLGDGLAVVSDISVARPVSLGLFLETPSLNYNEEFFSCEFFSRDNLILVYMSVFNEDKDAATAVYDPASQMLNVNLDLGTAGFTAIPFRVEQSAFGVSINAQLDAALDLQEPVPNMANYNAISGRLVIPSISVNGEIVRRNVVFNLTDANSASFSLRSFD